MSVHATAKSCVSFNPKIAGEQKSPLADEYLPTMGQCPPWAGTLSKIRPFFGADDIGFQTLTGSGIGRRFLVGRRVQLCLWRGSIPPGLDATRTACAATSFDGGGLLTGGAAGAGGVKLLIGRDGCGAGAGTRTAFKGCPDGFGICAPRNGWWSFWLSAKT
jgi:hypothetical protein